MTLVSHGTSYMSNRAYLFSGTLAAGTGTDRMDAPWSGGPIGSDAPIIGRLEDLEVHGYPTYLGAWSYTLYVYYYL